MAHIGTLREYKFKGDVDDIRGANLYGRGGEKLGTVDDVVFDHAGGYIQYLVVDTGGWLKSNKFLVPADRVNARDDGGDFTCDITRERIETFPEYKDSIIRTRSDWENYEHRYRESFESSGGVLHREGSDHLITPEASEMPAITDEGSTGVSFTPERLVDKFSSAEPRSDKTRLRPSGIAARAEDSSMPGSSLSNEHVAWESEAASPRNRRATDKSQDPGSAFAPSPAQPLGQDLGIDPPAYRGEQDPALAGQRYQTNRRLRDFEETLRRNRVDITSSCRACGVEHSEDDKDKAA